MNRIKTYIRLLRFRHCIKNLIVFAPLFFSRQMNMSDGRFRDAAAAFFVFVFVSSGIYVFNDLKDVENDRRHPVKKNRAIACGAVGKGEAAVLVIFCLAVSAGIQILAHLNGSVFPILYVVINLCYSSGCKNIPFVDIAILASGFILRTVYGAAVTQIPVSGWLYLMIMAVSFFFAMGKRRNEMVNTGGETGSTRQVLAYYNYRFLDKGMYMCLALSNTYYSLWAMNHDDQYMIWTVPVVVMISLKYCLDIENGKPGGGDPTEVILSDRILLVLLVLTAGFLTFLLYRDSIGANNTG